MRALLSLGQVESGSSRHHFFPVVDEAVQALLEADRPGLPVFDGDEDRAEGHLQLRVLVELVQDHVGYLASLQFHHDPYAFLAGFVPQVGDAGDLLVVDQFRDRSDEVGFVDGVGYLGDDDVVLAHLAGLDARRASDLQSSAARLVHVDDLAVAADDAARREVRSGQNGHKLLKRHFRILDEHDQRVAKLAQVMRRNVGRHTDGDAARTVQKELRDFRGQHRRLGNGLVEVRHEVHGVLVDVSQHLFRQSGHAALGVAVSRGGVAVDGAEVALTVHQRIPHAPGLRHTNKRVVNGRVAVRVVLLQDFADHAGALGVFSVVKQTFAEHRVKNAAVHRFQTVPDFRQGAADDHAHGVIDEGFFHLGRYGDRLDFFSACVKILIHICLSFRYQDWSRTWRSPR